MLKNAGFTLIELLIVIVIIAILAVVGITLFNNVQSSAHDARRKADIQAIAQAMEAHYNPTSGAYPTALDATWFADGAIPTDPDGEPYPIIVGIDPDGSTPVNGFIVCTSSEVGSSCSESSQIKYDGPPIIISATPTPTPAATSTPTPTPTPAPDVITGLAGYWKLDEVSGNATDSSGNNNTLINNNLTAFTAGRFGNAASFVAASSQSLSIADANQTGLEGMVNYTFAAWINLTTASGSNPIITKSGSNGSHSYAFNHNNSALGVAVSPTGWFGAPCSNNQTSTAILSTGVWTHVAITYDGSYFRLYKNGVEQTSGSFPYLASGCTTANVNSDFSIGGGNQNGIFKYFNGKIDEVRVYNRTLSATEISYLSNLTP